MTTQNRIIIALLTLIIIIAMVWVVQNYQKTERQYQACLKQCLCPSEGYRPVDCRLCESKCNEKYGK